MTKNLMIQNSKSSNTNSDGKFNVTYDTGHLLIYDNGPFNVEDINEEEMTGRLSKNLKTFYGELYGLLKKQKGENEEKTDFDKAADCLKLPKPVTILPRAKPIPKPKPLTKWEKYRIEKGLQAKEKRSRMVYSELASDWVPRWGKGR
jgi:regulator of ribosome biosynthesis